MKLGVGIILMIVVMVLTYVMTLARTFNGDYKVTGMVGSIIISLTIVILTGVGILLFT